jgi:hypothetical protein
MHQHQLLVFASKFGFFEETTSSKPRCFTAGIAYKKEKLSFLSPVINGGGRKLTQTQLKHLREHYKTVHSIADIQDPKLANIDDKVQVWHRCQRDKTIFHCSEYKRRNSTRLSHLACIEQLIDRNSKRSELTHPEVMIPADFYVYIQFFCVHSFGNDTSMLMYSQYRDVRIHDGLVEDLGPKNTGFQDIEVLRHLCAKVSGEGGKTYLVDDQMMMENRLLQVIRSRKRNRQ